MDLRNNFEIPFQDGKPVHVICTEGEAFENKNGKAYCQHILIGINGERYEHQQYVNTDPGIRFYTRFLSQCGITREQTAEWEPKMLDGKFLTVEFRTKHEEYDIYDDDGNPVHKEIDKQEMAYAKICTATDAEKVMLKEQASGTAPF